MDYEIFLEMVTATQETLIMVFVSAFLSTVFGTILGIILTITNKGGLYPNIFINQILGFIVNIGRSIPFIILLVILIPLSKFLAGSSIGVRGVIVPLTFAATPFFARLTETTLKEIDNALIEALLSCGARIHHIIFAILKETAPSMISNITVLLVNIVGLSAMAGAVGAGGIGDLALRYGYYRFQTEILIYATIEVILLVQIIQFVGNFLSAYYNKAFKLNT